MKSQLRIRGGGKGPFLPSKNPVFFADFFIPPGNMSYSNCLSAKQLDFFEKCKNELKNGVLPKKVPLFYSFFGQNQIDPFFFAEFFIPPGNMFIRTVFLRNNSIFLKKCQNGLKFGVLAKTSSTFLSMFLPKCA